MCCPTESPIEAILCLDSYQSMYSQMLCGLCQNREVVRVGSLFASAFIRAMRFLEDHWSQLCNDIRTGTINNKITDPKVIEAVMKILKPDSELADFIEAECSKDSWEGIVTRLWPNTKYVDVVVTGAMSQYIPMLDYYSNSLPLVSTVYGSSECSFGINLNPLCKPSEVSYMLIPTMGYFEFLPMNRSNEFIDSISISTPLNEKDEQQLVVDLVDVKIGQEYELVVTTYSGLYRYRVGDVLRVAGYKNNTPQFNFIRRENVILSIDFDKTNEFDLQKAVNNVANNLMPFDARVVDYTSYADIATIPGHYVLFWELRANASPPIPHSVLEDCCLTIEESFDSVYCQGRTSDKSIGPLEIRIVEAGTFDKLMDYCSSSLLGASINQYKTPRCVKFAPLVELLNARVVSSYFSPVCPKWVPGMSGTCIGAKLKLVQAGSVLASSFIRAMRFLEDHWSLLRNDIRTGTINNKTTDPSVREAVMKSLKPDSELADFIEAECSKNSWEGIITRLWPNTKYVDVVVTGAMSQYIPMLDYYCNSLPLVSTTYASSECFFGINLSPLCKPSEVSYTLIPTVGYFEFLPIHRSNEFIDSISIPTPLNEKDEQQLVDLVDVKIGQEYELIVTTYSGNFQLPIEMFFFPCLLMLGSILSGLYRYRVGDVLRVAGYKNNAPQFNFIRRENVILSIDLDKTNEFELQNAVNNAANNLMLLDARVVDYTSYADTATIPGHYVLFWELSVNGSAPIPPSVLEDCCLTIEESLNSVCQFSAECSSK
ncbi:hypothetical protein MTR67_042219 [Solanum verrucosum]|uniref:Indole-3-acetic acid-amido synthetase GH3.6 n=1 Tax=Solanum verrucosum TaxID=315347 RepID=A0AAF0UMV8_SOLVR|nr:hypothetical protein MTR67_042219 [Solanum verrucosum]